MRAITQRVFGGPDVLELKTVDLAVVFSATYSSVCVPPVSAATRPTCCEPFTR